MNQQLATVTNASGSTATNVTILATLDSESFTSQKGVKGHLVTNVNFLSCIFSKDMLGPAYNGLSNVNFLNGGAVLSNRTKVVLAVKIVADNATEMIDEEMQQIYSYLN